MVKTHPYVSLQVYVCAHSIVLHAYEMPKVPLVPEFLRCEWTDLPVSKLALVAT